MKCDFLIFLIVLPSSGQSHPLEAQIFAPGGVEARLQNVKTRNQPGAGQE